MIKVERPSDEIFADVTPLMSINLCSLRTCYRNRDFVQWTDGIIRNVQFIL